MKKITYFDLGVWQGQEIDQFIQIATELNLDYKVIGFEPDATLFYPLYLKYVDNKAVQIFNVAISIQTEIVNLYKSLPLRQGNSIFDTKNNVDKNDYDPVLAISLSSILTESNLGDINIIRFNIEGAELYLMQDIISNGKRNLINLFCGSTPDINKVSEIANLENDYCGLLKENNINVLEFYYTEDKTKELEMLENLKRNIVDLKLTDGKFC